MNGKNRSNCAGPANGRRRPQRWLRLFQAAAVAFLLVAHSSGAYAAPAAANSRVHVFFVRGLLNVFSLGLDEIANKLNQKGIKTTVANHVFWSAMVDEAVQEYKSGQVRTIILVGHSLGATVLPDMVELLSENGVPVKLAIGLDSILSTTLSGKVGRYINFYVADGAGTPVKRGKKLRGKLDNIGVEKPGLGHMTIDKNAEMQRKVINAINASL